MDREPLTPAFVQEYLHRIAGLDVPLEDAAAIIPNIEGIRDGIAALDKFDVQEVRPATVYDPT
jgi:hypothetical protein